MRALVALCLLLLAACGHGGSEPVPDLERDGGSGASSSSDDTGRALSGSKIAADAGGGGIVGERMDSGVEVGDASDASEPDAELGEGGSGSTAPADPCKGKGPGDFVCLAGSCMSCGGAGSGAYPAGSGGSAGIAGAAGSPGKPASCPDSDADGVCDVNDKCPGNDNDSDGNGYPDGCDQVLFSAKILPTTENVSTSSKQILGFRGTLQATPSVALHSGLTSGPKSWSFDAGDASVEDVTAFLAGSPWTSATLNICAAGPLGVSTPCWWSRGSYVDLTKKTITRFILDIDTAEIEPVDSSHCTVRAGGRWEIRGY